MSDATQIASPKARKRCAVYCRVSSDERLDQEFNSIDAQKEAGHAYVASQRAEGWIPVADDYDDPGFSGGNTDRPGLKRLMADIERGQIDIVVVYKVDRLTRSLSDFAKLVDLFDAKGVSFVSVTQQFNTTTSMGRLTLNVLLSFAQFEREVTGERIRDKIAASKRKGLWMGGVVPVGYQASGRTLVPDEEQAVRLREIYQLYLQMGSVRELGEELQRRGWLTPARAHKRAGFGGNKPFSRGHLYRILSNPVYIGLMVHKGQTHPGQHPAIIDEALWKAVQAKLDEQRNGHKSQSHATNPSLLSGKLFDETGRRLVPSHARKGQRRYRYYVTPADDPGPTLRLPANEIEELVADAVATWARDPQRVLNAVGWSDAQKAQEAIAAGAQLAQDLTQSPREHLSRCVEAVEVGPSLVRIALDLVGCGMVDEASPQQQAQIEVAAGRKRCGMAVRLVVAGPQGACARGPDPRLVELLNKARDWLERLTQHGQGIADIAKHEGVSAGYVTRLLHLALLAPDITQSIAVGDHPREITATRLMRAMPLPLDWGQQRQLLGMA